MSLNTFTLYVGADGQQVENEPYGFSFVNLLSDLATLYGGTWTISGTPAVVASPPDGKLTLGSVAVNTDLTIAALKITLASAPTTLPASYSLSCLATLTDGTHTAQRICPGSLVVRQVGK